MNDLVVVILAAGKGTRMKSDITKVCHLMGNKTMIEHVVGTARTLKPKDIVIVVSKDNIKSIGEVIQESDVRFKIQYQQLGTGHAVLSAAPCCDDQRDLLVLLGDVPLISSKTLGKIISTSCDAVIMGFRNNDSKNRFGRIIIKNNRVNKIVEYLDATLSERLVPLCNSGILWIKAEHVPLLDLINNDNRKGEYYLTDIIGIMVGKGLDIGFLEASYDECMGVNTSSDLNRINEIYAKIDNYFI